MKTIQRSSNSGAKVKADAAKKNTKKHTTKKHPHVHPIRKRLRVECQGRPKSLHVRMSIEASSRLASLQGLCWRYGKRETVAALFDIAGLPAIEQYCKPYTEAARQERERARQSAAASRKVAE